MHDNPSLILASSSKSRNIQLQQMNYPFLTVAPNIDETPLKDEHPRDMVIRLAKEKAQVVASQYTNHFIIAGDQVQAIENIIQGKPHTVEAAIKQLLNSSNQTTQFYSGLCVMNSRTNEILTQLVTTEVKFKPLTLEQIKSYLSLDRPLECAGSIRIEGMAACLIESIKTQDPMAIVGLPLLTLCKLLDKLGFSFLKDNKKVNI